jgi:hypothetical protein
VAIVRCTVVVGGGLRWLGQCTEPDIFGDMNVQECPGQDTDMLQGLPRAAIVGSCCSCSGELQRAAATSEDNSWPLAGPIVTCVVLGLGCMRRVEQWSRLLGAWARWAWHAGPWLVVVVRLGEDAWTWTMLGAWSQRHHRWARRAGLRFVMAVGLGEMRWVVRWTRWAWHAGPWLAAASRLGDMLTTTSAWTARTHWALLGLVCMRQVGWWTRWARYVGLRLVVASGLGQMLSAVAWAVARVGLVCMRRAEWWTQCAWHAGLRLVVASRVGQMLSAMAWAVARVGLVCTRWVEWWTWCAWHAGLRLVVASGLGQMLSAVAWAVWTWALLGLVACDERSGGPGVHGMLDRGSRWRADWARC